MTKAGYSSPLQTLHAILYTLTTCVENVESGASPRVTLNVLGKRIDNGLFGCHWRIFHPQRIFVFHLIAKRGHILNHLVCKSARLKERGIAI